MRPGKQTDRHTDELIAILCTPTGGEAVTRSRDDIRHAYSDWLALVFIKS